MCTTQYMLICSIHVYMCNVSIFVLCINMCCGCAVYVPLLSMSIYSVDVFHQYMSCFTIVLYIQSVSVFCVVDHSYILSFGFSFSFCVHIYTLFTVNIQNALKQFFHFYVKYSKTFLMLISIYLNSLLVHYAI